MKKYICIGVSSFKLKDNEKELPKNSKMKAIGAKYGDILLTDDNYKNIFDFIKYTPISFNRDRFLFVFLSNGWSDFVDTMEAIDCLKTYFDSEDFNVSNISNWEVYKRKENIFIYHDQF